MDIKIKDTILNISEYPEQNCIQIDFRPFDKDEDNKHIVVTPSAIGKGIVITVVKTKDLVKP